MALGTDFFDLVMLHLGKFFMLDSTFGLFNG